MRRTFRAMQGIAMALLTVACGDDDEPTVTREPVAMVRLSRTQQGLITGQSTQLSATPLDRSGGTLGDRAVSWRSENTAVATVTSAGLVTAKGVGATNIVAASEGKDARAAVTVTAPPPNQVASVTLDVSAFSIEEGFNRQLAATPRDAHGTPLEGLGLTWTSSDENVARVGALGLVSGNSAGIATITVRVHGKTAQATVTVSSDATHDLIFAAHAATSSGVFRLDIRQPNAVPVRIFPEGTSIGTVRPSPDGSKLAFAATIDGTTGIFVANRDGTDRQRVVGWEHGTPSEPTWSPDGTRLAYTVRANSGGTDIWVVTVGDASTARNITADVEGVSQSMSAWSPVLPDGSTRIAFVQPIQGYSRIWTMRPDGTGKRQITSGMADVQPAWSPDGQTVAYQRSDAATFGDIWLVDASSGERARALMPAYALPGPQWAPQWSPDARMVAFTSAHETYGSGSPVQQVYTVWADGSKLARRTGPDAVEKSDPAWIRR